MRKGIKHIGEVIGTGPRRAGLSRTIAMASIATAWEEHMRRKFSAGSAVNSITEGIVHVSVEEPVWAQQMSMLAEEILTELGTHCDLSGIKGIRFSSFGSVVRPKAGKRAGLTRNDSYPVVKELDSIQLSADFNLRVDALSSELPDGLKRSYELSLKTEALSRAKKNSPCLICGVPVASRKRYCNTCAIRPQKEKLRSAVAELMENPLSSDEELRELLGIGADDPLMEHELFQSSREAASRRLYEEALLAARAQDDNGGKEGKKAWSLLVAGACASTGKAYDAIISDGLEKYVPVAVLRATGIGTRDEKGDKVPLSVKSQGREGI